MPGVTWPRSIGLLLASVLLSCVASPTWAQIRFDLPPQPLAQALTSIGSLANLNVYFDPALVDGHQAPALKASLTVDEALTRLLAGTRLHVVRVDEHTVRVVGEPAEKRAQSTHPPDTGANYALPNTHLAYAGSSQTVDVQDEQRLAAADDVQTAVKHPEQGLAEVIVSAERREESLDRVPISITAFSQTSMDEMHIQSFADLATIVPGLDSPPPAAVAQGGYDVAIRGIFSGGNAPTTALYIDETPIAIRQLGGAGPSGSFHPDIFDLDRVEVLRGPQGTLFGSSAMGGAIRFITPEPSVTQSSFYTKGEVQFTDRGAPSYAIGVAYGAPIVEGLAGFRLSGWYHSDGGFVDIEDPFTGRITNRNANASSAYTFRPAFTVIPVDGLTITPAVFIQHQHSDEPAEYWLTLLPNPQPGKPTSGAQLVQPLWDNITIPSLAVKYEFLGMTLQSDTSYLDRSFHNFDDATRILDYVFSGSPFPAGVPPSFTINAEQRGGTAAWQQELRLSSPASGSRLHWVLGAYYRKAKETLSQLIFPDLSPLTQAIAGQTSDQYFGVPNYVLNGQVLDSYTNFTATDQQKAIFGELALDVTSRLKATVGVRFEHSVVKDQREVVAGPVNGVAYSNIVLPDQVQNPITPRFGLTYQYTDHDMVYATAAKGYRAGGGNSATSLGNSLCTPSLSALGLSSVPNSFNGDSVWSYEVGAKDTLLDGRLALQTSAFYIKWSDIQTLVNLPSCNENFTTNRGNAVSRGFDLQIAAVPIPSLKLSATVGYTDAYYPNAAYGAPPASGGPPPLLNGAGDKLSNVLPWTAAAHAEYTLNIGSLWAGARSYIRADYRWLDAMPKGDPNVTGYDPATGTTSANAYANPSYQLLNIRLGVQHEGMDLSVFVNNVTNANPRLSYTHIAPGDPLFYATALRPLTAGLTLVYRY